MTEPDHKGIARVEGNVFRKRGFDTSKQGYETSQGFFGGTIKKDNEGKTVFDMRPGFDKAVDTFDRFGDPRLRTTDEHVANTELFAGHRARVWKNRVTGVLETLHLKGRSEAQKEMDATWEQNKAKWKDRPSAQNIAPRSLLKLAAEGFGKGYSMRYRGTPKEIGENIDRLGLQEYYAQHPWGIEIKKPEIYTDGVSLYDIIVAKKEGKTPLEKIDHNQTLAQAAKYVRTVHDAHGGIGELLIMDIQFQNRDGNAVSNPVLGIPDIVWNKDAVNSETTRKATDILDFLTNVSFWEKKAETPQGQIQEELDTILQNYGDEKVIKAVRAFANPERGGGTGKKLTLPGEEGKGLRAPSVSHNSVRLGAQKEWSKEVRQGVFDATVRYLHPTPQAS